MRLLITGVCVLVIGFAFGQESIENQKNFEYGVALSVGDFKLNSNYLNNEISYLNAGFDISLNNTISSRIKLVYGVGLNKLIYKKGPTKAYEYTFGCFPVDGTENNSGMAHEVPLYYEKEVYLLVLKFGAEYAFVNKESFQSFITSSIEPFYNFNIDIHQTISPGPSMCLNGGLGINYKLNKLVTLVASFELGKNPRSFFKDDYLGVEIINYQSSMGFLIRL